MSNTTLFLLSSCIWGSTWLGITFQLGVVAPEVSVAYRFALAAALLAAWCALRGVSLRFSRRDHAFLAATGATLFGFNYVAVYWAERYVTSGLVAVVFATIVFMSPVGMRLVYREPLAARTLFAAALGVAGVALMFLPELDAARHGGRAGLGIAFALVSTVIATAGNLFAVRNHKAGLPTFPATAWGMGYGALAATFCALATGAPWAFDPRAPYVLSLVYLAVFGSVVAFGAYLTLLKRIGAAPTAFVGVATPVIAMLLSTLLEGYRWTWLAAFGVGLAIAGNVLAMQRAPRVARTA